MFGEKSQKSKRELIIKTVDKIDKDMLFATMDEYNKIGALMCTNWEKAEKGLVGSHAYSILDVHNVYGTKLI